MEQIETWHSFFHQWADSLNHDFLKASPEQRRKKLPNLLGQCISPGSKINQLEHALHARAEALGCSPSDLELNLDWPESIDW